MKWLKTIIITVFLLTLSARADENWTIGSQEWFSVNVLCLPTLALTSESPVYLGDFFNDGVANDISGLNKHLTFRLSGGLGEVFHVSTSVSRTVPAGVVDVDLTWKWIVVSGNHNETLGPNHPDLSYTNLTLYDGGSRGQACDAYATFTIQAMSVTATTYDGPVTWTVNVQASITI